MYRSVLDRLVSFHLLLQESETLSISADDAAVEARIESIRAGFPSDDAFETQLSSWETTLDALREETRRDLVVERVLESAVLPDIDVDVETARAFYELHSEQFTAGGGVRARHILIGLSPDASDQEKNEARDRAERLRRDAASGTDFAELAGRTRKTQGRRPTAATSASSSEVRRCRPSRQPCSRSNRRTQRRDRDAVRCARDPDGGT